MHTLQSRLKIFSLLTLGALSSSIIAPNASAEVDPGEKCFTITGYYSPLPPEQQRIYSNEGSDQDAYEKEKRLNGQGVRTADGTAPYVGVVAAPSAYPFGTKIGLDGIGTFTVRDRGGAIVEAGERGYSCDRIDVYTGSGEEGLAKALHIGKRTVQGQIYAEGQAPAEGVDLSWLSNQLPSRLLNLIGQTTDTSELLSPTPYTEVHLTTPNSAPLVVDERPLAEKLAQLGYADITHFQVDHGVIPTAESYGSGVYGPQTQAALELALKNNSKNPVQSESKLTQVQPEQKYETQTVPKDHWLLEEKQSLQPGLHVGSEGGSVESLQRVLWQLSLYQGPISGQYDDKTETAVFEFQKKNQILSTEKEKGAGVYGPKTHTVMQEVLEKRLEKITPYPQEVQVWMPKRQELPVLNSLTLPELSGDSVALNFNLDLNPKKSDPLEAYRHLKLGDRGAEVIELQGLLIEKGLLEAGLNTGYYGEMTQEAVLKFKD